MEKFISSLFFPILGTLLISLGNGLGQAQDCDWVLATQHAGWSPRDSAIEFVFKDNIWVIGGWDSSHAPGPRDVWKSPNGKDWEKMTSTAPWKHGDLSTSFVYKEKMWLMGGWFGGRAQNASASNQVWSSTDGVHWDLVSKKSPWSPRLGAAGVVFNNRMWLFGGVEKYFTAKERHLKNDVWFSEDGKIWKRAVMHAPWRRRAYHCALVFDNKIWVLGGGNYLTKYNGENDVWNSVDGIYWKKVETSTVWPARIWFSAVEYQNKMWVLGGWSNNPSVNWNDVWYSSDGSRWFNYRSSVTWPERHEHSTVVFDNKIWVMGGNAYPLKNDVWSLEITQQGK